MNLLDRVFIEKPTSRRPIPPIGPLLRRRVTKGEIGIEIECEGNKFQKEAVPSPWMYTKDGSLRGKDNAEYVLQRPIMFSEVEKAIETLWSMMSDYGTVLDESNRTSVHVHLNVQSFHLSRLCAFMAMYFSIEEILTEWCGEHRVGNLFCLRAKDAPDIVSSIKSFIQTDGRYEFHNGMHYAGLNAGALFKFGSIEIRSLRGVTDPALILDWVAVLRRLYEMSADFKDPRLVCDDFSGAGPLAYLEKLLGDKYHTIMSSLELSNQQVMESLYDGIRIAQDLCYCRDWEEVENIEVKSDPFGRSVLSNTTTPGSMTSDSSFDAALAAVQNFAQMYTASTNTQPSYSLFSPSTAPNWSQTHPVMEEYEPDLDDFEEDFEPDYDEDEEDEE